MSTPKLEYKSEDVRTVRDVVVDLETFKQLKILSIENDLKIQQMAAQILIKHFAKKKKKEDQNIIDE